MADTPDQSLAQLVDKLTKALGEDLVSVILYGSAAVGDHSGKYSDLNVMCVLERIEPPQMRAAEPVFRWWREKGNPSPLLLTAQEVETSTDCFAIEFYDIKESRRVLHGRDVIETLTVEGAFYRAQVEHELRAKLLRLRQKAAGVLSDKDILRNLMADSVSTFCVLFRHALSLHGAAAPQLKREVVEAAAARFGIDASPFHTLLDLRDGKIKSKDVEPEALLASYMTEIGRVVDAVDRLEKNN